MSHKPAETVCVDAVSTTAPIQSSGQPFLRRVLDRFSGLLDAWNPYDPERLPVTDLMPVVVEESEIRRSTLRLLLLFLGVFFVWACVAPLDAGVNVPGTVVVLGNRKAVQHPTGGVVTDILVKEGDAVQAGQILLKINPLTTEANLAQSELEYLTAMATESRLQSERSNLDDIRWLPDLLAHAGDDPRVRQVQLLQQQLFASRRQEFASQQTILAEQARSLQDQLLQIREVLRLKRSQLVTLEEEAKNHRELASRGFVSVSRSNEVERQLTDMLAAISNNASDISRMQSQLTSTRLQQSQQRSTYLKEVDSQLSEVQKLRKALRSRVESLQFDRNLAEVRAPVAGVVVGLKVNTVGGVMPAAQLLMEVVPRGGNLIVEARVPPASIDKVRVGMKADMRYTAFNLNSTPVIEGEVRLVGADKVTGGQPGEDFYLAQIETTDSGLQALGSLQIQPGMPVEVIVKTGERTFLSYLFKPISDRLARSFKD